MKCRVLRIACAWKFFSDMAIPSKHGWSRFLVEVRCGPLGPGKRFHWLTSYHGSVSAGLPEATEGPALWLPRAKVRAAHERLRLDPRPDPASSLRAARPRHRPATRLESGRNSSTHPYASVEPVTEPLTGFTSAVPRDAGCSVPTRTVTGRAGTSSSNLSAPTGKPSSIAGHLTDSQGPVKRKRPRLSGVSWEQASLSRSSVRLAPPSDRRYSRRRSGGARTLARRLE